MEKVRGRDKEKKVSYKSSNCVGSLKVGKSQIEEWLSVQEIIRTGGQESSEETGKSLILKEFGYRRVEPE